MKIDDEFVLIGGSKNSHLILSLNHGAEDLKLYSSSSWKVAKLVMEAIFDLFQQIGEEKTLKFVSFLANYHLTANFEMLDPDDQHIELLTNSKPMVRFITFTPPFSSSSSSQNYLCLYPLHAVHVAELFDIPTITCDVFPLSGSSEERNLKFEQIQNEIRQDVGNEGKVLYFAAEEEVIGLLKKKTVWYILLRALREKFKLYAEFLNRKATGKPTRNQTLKQEKEHVDKLIQKRMGEIQKWLAFSDETKMAWIDLGLKASDWIVDNLSSKKLKLESLRTQFPVVWDRFLIETDNSDKIPLK